MREDVLVSVVIPVYNTEQYLERTMKCLLNQTYKNWEAIFIDDGSVDGSGELLDKFEALDNRISVIHKVNEGVSIARNVGIDNIKGKKVLFLDSDDIFEKTLIEKCVRYIELNQVEAVLYGYADMYNGTVVNVHEFVLEKEKYIGNDTIIQQLMPHFLGISYEDINGWIKNQHGLRYGKEHTAMWRIMCDVECIKKNAIRFNKNLSVGENTMFMNEYLYNCNSIGVLKDTLYYLVAREGSANNVNNHNVELMINNKLKLVEEKNKFAERVKEHKQIDITGFFDGNNVLSTIQIMLMLINSQEYKIGEKYEELKAFYNNQYIKNSILKFKPVKGIKSIPIVLLRHNRILLMVVCSILPQKIMGKIV